MTGGGGQLLVLLELLELDVPPQLLPLPDKHKLPELAPSLEALPSLEPHGRPALLRMAVLGLRGVRPAQASSLGAPLSSTPRRPFVQIDAGSSTTDVLIRRTSASNQPSATNPVYLEVPRSLNRRGNQRLTRAVTHASCMPLSA